MLIAPWLIAAGISAGSGILGHLAGAGGRKRQKKARHALWGLGEELRGFDPMGYAEEASEAQWNMLQNPLSEALGDYRASQVGRGRLKTGFSFQGEDRMLRDVFQNFTDQMAARSMEGAQMKLGSLGMAGDVYSGFYDMGAREEQDRRNFWGGLGRDIGSAYLFRSLL